LIRDEFEEQTWQAFWLTTVEDRSSTDAAVALGMSAGAVRKAKARVLHRLRQEFGDVLS
jgi:RNA polymerase sigma-70 factor (ECF subfamily)